MSESIINIRSIGTGGLNTDKPPWAVSSDEASEMSDVIIHNGLATQRRGWAKFGYTNAAVTTATQGGIYEVRATGITTDIMSATVGSERAIYCRDHSGVSWVPVFTTTGTFTVKPDYQARAQYQDEILFCDRNGIYPMLRFLGSPSQIRLQAVTANIAATNADISSDWVSSAGVGTEPGVFMHPFVGREVPSFRLTKNASGVSTAKNLSFVTAAASSGAFSVMQSWGTTWPAVSVENDGTVTTTAGGSTITGTGTQFTGAPWGSVFAPTGLFRPMADSVRIQATTNAKWVQHPITSVGSASSLNTRGTLLSLTRAPYDIMRRCPFAEAEVHQECLWGTGVSQYPNRVYYSPRLWDMQTPPELTPPWNGITDFYDPNSGTLRYTEIEGSGDGDKVVSLISSDGPILILTRRACWGAYGSWPNFQRNLIAAGAGCIDNRSAVGTNAYGQYWAGEAGVYGFRGGRVTDLTSGRINTEWRELMELYEESSGSYVVAGVTRNHLIVSTYVTRGGVNKYKTLSCNITSGAWSEISNTRATSLQAPVLSSGNEQLIASRVGSKQLIDITPAISMEGTAADGNAVYPALSITLGSANHNAGDPDTEGRLVELRLGAIVDGTAGTTSTISVETTSRGATSQSDATSTTSLVLPSSVNLNRKRIRVGNTGRTHEVTIQTVTTHADNNQIAIAEVGMNVRKRRAAR